jgi:RNA polymerase sigma factor (sigma-70 family)
VTACGARAKARRRDGHEVPAKSVVRLKVPVREDLQESFESRLVLALPEMKKALRGRAVPAPHIDDVVQEALTKLLLHRPTLEHKEVDEIVAYAIETGFHFWIRTAKGAQKSQERHRDSAVHRCTLAPAVESQFLAREALAYLDTVARTFPNEMRATLVACFKNGLSQAEAAAELGVPADTVHSRVRRIRRMLRQWIDRSSPRGTR